METISQNTSVKTNIIFSGGGSRGAWQWELFTMLEPHYDIESVCGSSTGALTALCAAKGIPRVYMRELYDKVYAGDARLIFKPGMGQIKNGKFKFNDWKFYPKLIFNRNKIKGMMSIDPLILLVENIQKEYPVFKYNFFFNVVDLRTSKTVRLSYADFNDDKEFAKGVAASCAIPGLVEPVYDIVTKAGVIKAGGDGGIREGMPAKQAFDVMDPGLFYQVIFLGCNRPEVTPTEDLNSIVGILGATATAVLNESMINDIDDVEVVNELVKEKGEAVMGKRYVTPFKIFYNGGRGVLEFTTDALSSMRQTAREDYERHMAVIKRIAA